MTGFDPSLVIMSINKVEDSYVELMQALYTDMQTKFVEGMSNCWACNLAQRFFANTVKPNADELLTGSFDRFRSVVETMNEAASKWAERTLTEWAPVSFKGELKNISVDAIKENINGERGIKESEANTVAQELPKIAASAEQALIAAENAVHGCGFVGRDQEEQLVRSLGQIRANISEFVTSVNNVAKNAIQQTIDAYGSLATNVSEAFAGSESGVAGSNGGHYTM